MIEWALRHKAAKRAKNRIINVLHEHGMLLRSRHIPTGGEI